MYLHIAAVAVIGGVCLAGGIVLGAIGFYRLTGHTNLKHMVAEAKAGLEKIKADVKTKVNGLTEEAKKEIADKVDDLKEKIR